MKILYKKFIKIIVVYICFTSLCVYIFQNSNLAEKILRVSSQRSARILDTIIFISFGIFVRLLMVSYQNATNKKISKAILYWDIFVISCIILNVICWILILHTNG